MKNLRIPLVALLSLAIISTLSLGQFGAADARAQNQSTALERGYRTGYSDGYNAGYKDLSDRAPREFQNKGEYQQANRSYNQAWGTEDYRDVTRKVRAGISGVRRSRFNSRSPPTVPAWSDPQRDPDGSTVANPDDEAIASLGNPSATVSILR